jgi:hypothetical protein
MKKLIPIFAIVSLLLTATPVFATEVNTDWSGSGLIKINASNTDANAWFGVIGSSSGTFKTVTDRSYLDTEVKASSDVGATLQFSAWQNLAGYTNNRVVTQALANGSTANMNLIFDNDMYSASLSRNGGSMLSASGNGYIVGFNFEIIDKNTQAPSAIAQFGVTGNGAATIDHATTWYATSAAEGYYGGGNPDGLSISYSAHDETNLLSVVATGSGGYTQYGFGAHSLIYNGMNMPGGGVALTTANFFNGFSANPSVVAK